MLFGIGAATVIRIALALVTLRLLAVIGLTFAGGLLLLWVCWRMLRELRGTGRRAGEAEGAAGTWRAIVQIIVADLSMSLDNVLAVAGAAHNVAWVLVVGRAGSVALTGLAAGLLLRLLDRVRWLAWAGLAIVLYVALEMIWSGWGEVGRWLGGLHL